MHGIYIPAARDKTAAGGGAFIRFQYAYTCFWSPFRRGYAFPTDFCQARRELLQKAPYQFPQAVPSRLYVRL